eukprot:Seg21115.1 transcript_id=Seg21115.1/GoldUCD/mRNA.D3Y31 product="hypothetical protein" protein_id=Seg21115.1/GoldUCD/D3Y31
MKTKLIGAGMALGIASSANAAIVFAGSVIDDAGSEVTQWRTAATVKSLDGDGDNVYGTFGGIAYAAGGTSNAVGAANLVSSQGIVGPFPGYATIDNILGGADVAVATTTNNAVAGTDQVMATFSITSAVALGDTLRVGIMIDGLDGAGFSPASIGLAQVGSADVAEQAVTANNTVDMYFFDVTGGVAANTQFQVIADSGTGDFVTHQAVSLDVIPAPEPSSTALLGLGGLALILRRRK